MSEPSDAPRPYVVSYSGRVRDALKELAIRARQRGLEIPLAAAIQALDHRLRVYPQFGQPLRDLTVEPAQLWIATVPPLVVKYLLDEECRLVMVAQPITPLPGSGL